jgi:hypothetical protein
MEPNAEGRSNTRTLTSGAWLRSVAGVFLVLALEGITTFALARREVTSSWELTHGLANLAPLLLPAGALIGLLAGWLLSTWAASDARPSSRWVLTALVAFASGIAAWSVGGGRHLATLGSRLSFAGIVAAAAAAAVWWVAPRAARGAKAQPILAVVVACVGIVVLELANRFVLVRLYPGFHAALALATLCVAPLTLWEWTDTNRTERAGRTKKNVKAAIPIVALVALCAAATLAIPGAARALARFDNLRLILIDRAPLLGQAVRLAARFAPPAPVLDCGSRGWDASCGQAAQGQAMGAGPSFSLRGRDILMITVDALRADHLGAYGYGRRTSPNIDRLASAAVKFEHAYAPTAHTSYSVTSMMTGKYMRPLLLQGAGADSDTLATLLRRYGYRTAAFYPPAVFFIDPQRFVPFRDSFLGFEYRKVEFMEGPGRVEQVTSYLAAEPPDQRLFVWVHLFGPHEPYEARPGFDFGSHDVDRYDSEIAYADAAIGDMTQAFLSKHPGALIIVSADHGEEFGDHGGRYHGATVYEEQVRVPLIFYAPELFKPRTVQEPVQTIDVLPTVLTALDVPQPPRVRGRNLASALLGQGDRDADAGLALAESEDQVMLAQGTYRLLCQRQLGACRLFDVSSDPGEQTDLAGTQAERFERMRRREREMSASHGQFEAQGLRAEGKGWPNAILRGVAGDGDAAEEIASLLDDADSSIRRKAAELLFDLNRPSTTTALRLALTRDEDPVVRAWCALALTRAGQGAPLVFDLLNGRDARLARLAALALADAGDGKGVEQLIAWWRDEPARNYQQSRWLLAAFAHLHAKSAVPALVRSLGDVRLRPHIAAALAEIGDTSAREPLARAFADERYQNARVAIAQALVQLHAREEVARPLMRFLGVPDPIPGGLGFAQQAKVLQYVGGPEPKQLTHLTKQANLGVRFNLVIPKAFAGQSKGLRLIVKVTNQGFSAGEIRILPVRTFFDDSSNTQKLVLRNFSSNELAPLILPVAERAEAVELHRPVPPEFRWVQGSSISIDLMATSGIRVEALAVVPLADELPPPPPQPWLPDREPAHPIE